MSRDTCTADRPSAAPLHQREQSKEGDHVERTEMEVIELLAESDKSREDAAATAVERARHTVGGVQSTYFKRREVKVENSKIVQYRVKAQVSFLLG